MTDINWKDRLENQRDTASATIASFKEGARKKLDELGIDGRQIAQAGLERSSAVAKQSKKAIDKAVFSSRGLIAERPLTAIAVGVVSGVVLGLLANRVARKTADTTVPDEDDDYGA